MCVQLDIARSNLGPRIQHFHLRFLRKIADLSVTAIAHNMTSLYSLDLSFCTRASLDSIIFLLEKTGSFLCELRLYNCSQIDLTLPVEMDSGSITDVPIISIAGARLVEAIRLNSSHGTLCLLDVRGCIGSYPNHTRRIQDVSLGQSMNSFGYNQPLPGFFQRPTQWTRAMKHKFHSYLIEGN